MRNALDKIIDDIFEDPTTKRLNEAEMTYIEQITKVNIATTTPSKKFGKVMSRGIESLTRSIIAITDAAQKANGHTELMDAQSAKIKAISALKDQQEKARTTQEGKICKLFDQRLGGIKTSGKDENALRLNEDVEKILQKKSKTLFLLGSSHSVQNSTRVCQLS